MKRILRFLAVAFILAAMVVDMAAPAFAKITPVVIAQFCENPAGHQAPGQQPTCSGQAQEQVTITENQNPADHAPPGQNK